MSKQSIRIPLPKGHPEKFVQLLRDILKRHEELGVSSPLNDTSIIDMADFKAKLLVADALREESIELRATADAKMEQAKVMLGITPRQTINIPGTLYYMLDSIKRLLVVKNKGVEQSLERFGFHVVMGTTKKVGRKKKQK